MPPKTPDFWFPENPSSSSVTANLLRPISALYALGHKIKTATTNEQSVSIPVLCIGNITAGGSGKTPTAIALHHLIIKEGLAKNPFFLTRGYGGRIKGHELVQPEHHSVKDTGDEPQILAKHSKTVISANRYLGAKLAHDLGADIILMDDGFQNKTLHKDISFLAIDGTRGLGNGLLIPAGPLREPISEALKRAHAIILIGEDRHRVLSTLPQTLPVFMATLRGCYAGDTPRPFVAFAGIGNPQKFFRTLKESSVNPAAFHAYADHHPYSDTDMAFLLSEAQKHKAILITTEKDHQRIPDAYRSQIEIFPVRLEWQDENAMIEFLKEHIDATRKAIARQKP